MNRLLRKKSFFSVLASVAAISLAACGGGGAHSTTLPQASSGSGTAAEYSGPLADATFKITIPVPSATSATARRPGYVSSSTTKVVFTLNSDTAGIGGAALTTFNTNNLGAKAVTLNSAQCPGTGPWTCTFAIKLPPGTDNVTMSAQDGSSNVLSQQTQVFTVVVAAANSFSVTLDAQVFTMGVVTSGSATQFAGAIGSAIPNSAQIAILSPQTSGSNAQNFTVAVKDKAGQPIIGPGLPTMTVTTANNTDITVSNVVQESNNGATPYSFTLTAAATDANVASTTPTDVTVKFTGANAPTDGITLVSQTFHVSNAKLMALSGGVPSQIVLYAYGDGQLVQFGTTITSAGSYGSHNASQVQFDNAQNLYIADFGNAGASAVFKIARSQFQATTPASTQITAPGGNPKHLEPYYMDYMDVAGDGTIVVGQDRDNRLDPESGSNLANLPDALIVAAAGSSTFTFGWNNIGPFTGFSTGCQCLAAAMSASMLTDSTHTTPFAYAAPMFNNPTSNPSQKGYLAVVYPNATAGTTTLTNGCDTASGTVTCYEMDSTSNVDATFQTWSVWDYKNQKLAFDNNDAANNFYKILDFAAAAGVVSNTSTVLDTVSLGTSAGFPYPMAVSRNGFVASPYAFTGAGAQAKVNIYDNSSGTKVLDAFTDTPVIGGGSGEVGVGFVSDATKDALVLVGKDATSGGNNVLRVYSLNTGAHTATRVGNFTLPFAPLDIGLTAQSHQTRVTRRGDRRHSF